MRKVMRGAYSKDYTEYICVDALDSLITPQYVSNHFQVILKENELRKIRFHDAAVIIGLNQNPTRWAAI